MSEIRPSSDLRNKHNKASQFCHENGNGDLAVMSTATYEKLTEKFELYNLLETRLKAAKNAYVKPFNLFLKLLFN